MKIKKAPVRRIEQRRNTEFVRVRGRSNKIWMAVIKIDIACYIWMIISHCIGIRERIIVGDHSLSFFGSCSSS